jgi:hypothetical protein
VIRRVPAATGLKRVGSEDPVILIAYEEVNARHFWLSDWRDRKL